MAVNSSQAGKRRRLDFAEDITIFVGSEGAKFTLPKAVATSQSGFFRSAMTSKLKEAKQGIVRLPEVEVDTFTSFLQWLYTTEVIVMEPDDIAKDQRSESQYERLAKLYMLGDYLQCIRLRNAVIDKIMDVHRAVRFFPGQASVSLAFTSTPEGCALQRLLTNYYLASTDAAWLEKNKAELPHTFLYALVHKRMSMQNRSANAPDYMQRCTYHEHNDEALKLPSCAN